VQRTASVPLTILSPNHWLWRNAMTTRAELIATIGTFNQTNCEELPPSDRMPFSDGSDREAMRLSIPGSVAAIGRRTRDQCCPGIPECRSVTGTGITSCPQIAYRRAPLDCVITSPRHVGREIKFPSRDIVRPSCPSCEAGTGPSVTILFCSL